MDYVKITEDRFDDVIKFLQQSCPDEPLKASIGYNIHDQSRFYVEKHHRKCLKDGYAIMAVDKDTGTVSALFL